MCNSAIVRKSNKSWLRRVCSCVRDYGYLSFQLTFTIVPDDASLVFLVQSLDSPKGTELTLVLHLRVSPVWRRSSNRIYSTRVLNQAQCTMVCKIVQATAPCSRAWARNGARLSSTFLLLWDGHQSKCASIQKDVEPTPQVTCTTVRKGKEPHYLRIRTNVCDNSKQFWVCTDAKVCIGDQIWQCFQNVFC